MKIARLFAALFLSHALIGAPADLSPEVIENKIASIRSEENQSKLEMLSSMVNNFSVTIRTEMIEMDNVAIKSNFTHSVMIMYSEIDRVCTEISDDIKRHTDGQVYGISDNSASAKAYFENIYMLAQVERYKKRQISVLGISLDSIYRRASDRYSNEDASMIIKILNERIHNADARSEFSKALKLIPDESN